MTERRDIPEKEIRYLAKRYQALRSILRLRIIAALSDGESNVRDLESVLHVSQPLLSWHLTQLRQAGFVHTERIGREVRYSINAPAFEEIVVNMESLLGFSLVKERVTYGETKS